MVRGVHVDLHTEYVRSAELEPKTKDGIMYQVIQYTHAGKALQSTVDSREFPGKTFKRFTCTIYQCDHSAAV